MIRDHSDERRGEIVQFGRRPIPPRACIVENKTHVRMFLAEMLDELGFIAREADTLDIRAMLREFRPDLIVLGPLNGIGEVRTAPAHAAGPDLRRQGDAVRRPQLGRADTRS